MAAVAPRAAALIARKQIRIRGIVQGIGFRPFVYRLARRFELHGSVLNASDGVLVVVEGSADALERFIQELATEHPPFARIDETTVTDLEPAGESGFTILGSTSEKDEYVLVSPDLATCPDCRPKD